MKKAAERTEDYPFSKKTLFCVFGYIKEKILRYERLLSAVDFYYNPPRGSSYAGIFVIEEKIKEIIDEYQKDGAGSFCFKKEKEELKRLETKRENVVNKNEDLPFRSREELRIIERQEEILESWLIIAAGYCFSKRNIYKTILAEVEEGMSRDKAYRGIFHFEYLKKIIKEMEGK